MTTMTEDGQVTLSKKVRDALGLKAGDGVEFDVERNGEVIMRKVASLVSFDPEIDRFEAARGKAQVKWRTDDLLAFLRGPS